MQNKLQFEKSPYLLQHKSNPVNWYPWGEEAFEKARLENKPVFLSIGYSTCHWCHVMAHESFEDKEAAELINRSYVAVKVDREERPDVDAVYMEACLAMTGSGGWPLTVLMTPDGKPFWAGTYLPRYMLISLLEEAARLWKDSRETLLEAGEELTNHLKNKEETRPGAPTRELTAKAAELFARAYDPKWGGFGRAPKFPSAHNIIFLMRWSSLTGEKKTMKMAEQTLESMYRGGLFDHVGGGFCRYSTDSKWLVPHFEKMLYDNALLIFAYAEAFRYTKRCLYKTIAVRTADYVLRELGTPEGGFCCGQDADSDGVEGKYYVFTPAEIREVLGKNNADIFCERYGITEKGNFEGTSIPNLIGHTDIDHDPKGISEIREKLTEYRRSRTVLHRDSKILTSWNGLMIAALARAGRLLNEPRYIRAAETAAGFINKNLFNSRGRLLARWSDGESAYDGKLDDHAFYAWGLLELYGSTLDIKYLAQAQYTAEHLFEYFFDRENGGLYPYPSDGEQLITRSKETYDGALPSGNSVGALVFSRLARLTGKQMWNDAAEKQYSYLAGAAKNNPMGHAFTMAGLLEELWPTEELIYSGEKIPPELTDLITKRCSPGLTVLAKTSENRELLKQLAPFTDAYPTEEPGKYYLCRCGTCSKAADSINELQFEKDW